MVLKGSAALTANTDTIICTVPAGKEGTMNINILNTTNSSVSVRLAIGSNPPAMADYVEYDVSLPGYGVLERTAIPVVGNENVVCRASAVGVTVQARGFVEEVA